MIDSERQKVVYLKRAALMISLLAGLGEAQADEMAYRVGSGFFQALLAGNLEMAQRLCAEVVNFDGQVLTGPEHIGGQLKRMAERARGQGLTLKKTLILSLEEMVKKYGPIPLRLRKDVSKGAQFVLARFNSQGAAPIIATYFTSVGDIKLHVQALDARFLVPVPVPRSGEGRAL